MAALVRPRMHGVEHVHGGPDPSPIAYEIDTGDPGPTTGGLHDLAVYSMPGLLTVGNGSMRKYLEADADVTHVRAAAGTAPVGAGLTVRVKVNGVAFATVTVPAGSNTATAVPAAPAIAAGSYLTFDVTATGTTTAGSDLTVTVWGRYS